jgi:hypothetical protein
MKKLLLLTALFGLIASPAFAWNYHYDDVFADGMTPFDEHNNTAPINYPGIGKYPSPGYHPDGGERYDLEGLNVKEDADFVYVAVANSFGHTAYSPGWRRNYQIGDLFIGKDGSGYSYAVNLNSRNSSNTGVNTAYTGGSGVSFMSLDNKSPWNPIPVGDGTWGTNSSVSSQAGPFMANGSEAGLVDYFLGYDSDYETGPLDSPLPPRNYTNTYVWELKIDKALIGDFQTLDFHLTLECGNDVVSGTYEAVPEPATLLLFGLGLVGAGIIRRRKR